MKVLVTGASGMLGSNIIQELLRQNHEVIGLVLPNQIPAHLRAWDLELYEGNILNLDDLIPLVKRVDAIIHAAAVTDIWPERAPYIREVNIFGTQNLITAAQLASIQRFVFIGTANSFGFGPGSKPGNESTPYQGQQFGLDYMDSKYKAQRIVQKAFRQTQLPAIILNPTFMFGPYDSKPGAGTMILRIAKGDIPGYADGGKNFVAAKDVATAAVNALKMGKLGECYITGNENLTFRQAFEKIARRIQAPVPQLPLPTFAVLSYGWINSQISKWTARPPKVSLPMARISTNYFFYDSSKAIRVLQLPQTPIEYAIQDCYEWMMRQS